MRLHELDVEGAVDIRIDSRDRKLAPAAQKIVAGPSDSRIQLRLRVVAQSGAQRARRSLVERNRDRNDILAGGTFFLLDIYRAEQVESNDGPPQFAQLARIVRFPGFVGHLPLDKLRGDLLEVVASGVAENAAVARLDLVSDASLKRSDLDHRVTPHPGVGVRMTRI